MPITLSRTISKGRELPPMLSNDGEDAVKFMVRMMELAKSLSGTEVTLILWGKAIHKIYEDLGFCWTEEEKRARPPGESFFGEDDNTIKGDPIIVSPALLDNEIIMAADVNPPIVLRGLLSP